MYKKYYSKFLAANPNVQHYASHSHHYWPDVTFDAVIEYWNDSAKYVDDKWGHFYSTKIPQTQKLISQILNTSYPEQISFAPSTHELVYRLISSIEKKEKIKILTTDSEFYSFDRQANRLNETDRYEVIKVPVEPFKTFEERFIQEIKKDSYDMVFFSHVFFNSGFKVQNFEKIIQSTSDKSVVVMDAYHGFMSIPTDLKSVEDRLYYVAGGYKYAQGGEGTCFLISPKGSTLRPVFTSWFATFGDLNHMQPGVPYANDGSRFAGSTMDFTALYRLHAVLSLFEKEGLTVSKIHLHIKNLQTNFLEDLSKISDDFLKSQLTLENLLFTDLNECGHFLTFNLKDVETVEKVKSTLKSSFGIITDSRSTRLRFGFGLYQENHIKF